MDPIAMKNKENSNSSRAETPTENTSQEAPPSPDNDLLIKHPLQVCVLGMLGFPILKENVGLQIVYDKLKIWQHRCFITRHDFIQYAQTKESFFRSSKTIKTHFLFLEFVDALVFQK